MKAESSYTCIDCKHFTQKNSTITVGRCNRESVNLVKHKLTMQCPFFQHKDRLLHSIHKLEKKLKQKIDK